MKQLSIFLAVMLMASFSVPAYAVDFYSFEAANSPLFGAPTSTDTLIPAPDPAQITDKDAAHIPPPFGSNTAYLPVSGGYLTPNLVNGGEGPDYGNTVFPLEMGYKNPPIFTSPSYYVDGSMGTLSIPAINLAVKVYENESLESMKKGAGHFAATSSWDGNAAFAAHNRGTNSYFGQIHTLKSGDRITYVTPYGSRTYEVYFVWEISSTDFSYLQPAVSNILTLITCARDKPEMRVCVQAKEVN